MRIIPGLKFTLYIVGSNNTSNLVLSQDYTQFEVVFKPGFMCSSNWPTLGNLATWAGFVGQPLIPLGLFLHLICGGIVNKTNATTALSSDVEGG